jgi:hypothetical protein
MNVAQRREVAPAPTLLWIVGTGVGSPLLAIF